MLLLKFKSDNIQNIGLFKDEASMIEWIETLPFVTKNNEFDYVIQYESFPLYYEHQYHNTVYPLTHLSHNKDIEITWDIIPLIEGEGIIDGDTLIDNYYFENKDIDAFVHARASLLKEIIDYCEYNQLEYFESGFGSEDGVYITSPGRFFIHLDPSTIEERKKYDDFNQFINDMQ